METKSENIYSTSTSPINTVVLLKQLNESIPHIETAHQKDVVLVLGKTGSGKSTTVNYLLGVRMEEKKDDRDNYFVVPAEGEPTYAPIGHTATSCTLYPTVYGKPNSTLDFGDCPGFGDTRGREEQIIVSISIELVVKKAQCIKAIVVVVSQDELTAGRGEVFKSISSMLGKLIRNPQFVKDSLLFVITKPNMRRTTRQGILNTVTDIANAAKDQIKTLGERYKGSKDKPKEVQDEEDKLSILALITEKNLFVIDVLEESRHLDRRDKILDFLNKANPIPTQQFRFNAFDEGRNQLNHLIVNIVKEGNPLFKRFNQLSIEINNDKNEIKNIQKTNETYTTEISNIKSGKILSEAEKEKVRKAYNDAIKANEKKIQTIIDEDSQYITPLGSKFKALEKSINQFIKQRVLDLIRKIKGIQKAIYKLEKHSVMDEYDKQKLMKELEELNKEKYSKKEKEIILKFEKLQTIKENIETKMSKFEMVERIYILDLALPDIDKFFEHLNQYKQHQLTVGNKETITTIFNNPSPFFKPASLFNTPNEKVERGIWEKNGYF